MAQTRTRRQLECRLLVLDERTQRALTRAVTDGNMRVIDDGDLHARILPSRAITAKRLFKSAAHPALPG